MARAKGKGKARGKPKSKYDPDPFSPKNAYKWANEIGRQDTVTSQLAKDLPRSIRSPKPSGLSMINTKNPGTMKAVEKGFNTGRQHREQRTFNTRYGRLTGGGAAPGRSQGPRAGGGGMLGRGK